MYSFILDFLYQAPEPSHPPSIPPNWGPRCHRGRKIQSLTPPNTQFHPPKLKYEIIEISEVFVNPYRFCPVLYRWSITRRCCLESVA